MPMALLAQSSKVLPQSSPKHGQVVTGIPHYAGTNCHSQGFYSCTNIMTKKQVGEERVYPAYTSISLKVRTGTQVDQKAEADAEAMEE